VFILPFVTAFPYYFMIFSHYTLPAFFLISVQAFFLLLEAWTLAGRRSAPNSTQFFIN